MNAQTKDTGLGAELAGPYALGVYGLAKFFGPIAAVQDVTFEVPRGTVHALLGGNGSGKSTLIKALAGVQPANTGTIRVQGKDIDASLATPQWARGSGVSFVHQNPGIFPDLTVMENFALPSAFERDAVGGIAWKKLHRMVAAVLEEFGIQADPRTPMGDLRPAVQTMIAVARALNSDSHRNNGILVLDEPTASLPEDEARHVLESARELTRRGHTVILVSHRLEEIHEYADNATFLRDGRLLETTSVSSLDHASMVKRIAGIDHLPAANVERRESFEGNLEVRQLVAGPAQEVTMDVGKGEIVGLAGLLGSGRSSVLKALFGGLPLESGSITLGGKPMTASHPADAMKRGVAYVPEDRNGDAGFLDLSLEDNFSIPSLDKYWKSGWFSRKNLVKDSNGVIDGYGVVVGGIASPFASMSGGNAQKVVIARWMERSPRLLLLDEPTQGVDVGARADIHTRIKSAAADGMSVLVVSSDPSELSELCDRVVGIKRGRVTGQLRGAEVTPANCAQLCHGVAVDPLTLSKAE